MVTSRLALEAVQELRRLPLLRPPVPAGGFGQVSGSRALSFLCQSRAGGVQGRLGRWDSFGSEMVGFLWRHTCSVFLSWGVIPRVLCEVLQPGPPNVTIRWRWHQNGDYRLFSCRLPNTVRTWRTECFLGWKASQEKEKVIFISKKVNE